MKSIIFQIQSRISQITSRISQTIGIFKAISHHNLTQAHMPFHIPSTKAHEVFWIASVVLIVCIYFIFKN